MPNRNRRRPRARAKRSGSNISPVRFHALLTGTLGAVTGDFTSIIAPRNSNFGVDEVSDQFDLYRLKQFRYRIHPMDPTDTTNQTAAWIPDIDVQTVTTAQNSTNPLSACQTPFCGVPSRWIRVPPSMLKGMLDWYKCSTDAGATEFEDQGILLIAGGLSDTFRVEVDGVFLFKNPVNAAIMLDRTISRLEKSGKVIRLPPPSPVVVKNTTPRGC